MKSPSESNVFRTRLSKRCVAQRIEIFKSFLLLVLFVHGIAE